jgi:peptidyl-prolyl cis-trans isomerase A (cyclophilin A)
MARPSRSSLPRALAVLVLVAGCGGEEASDESAELEAEPVGYTPEGEQIVFAGAQRRQPARAEAPRAPAKNTRGYDESRLVRTPNAPDPENGEFTLEEAVVGLPIDGTLVAEIRTEFGVMLCDLHADRAPRTVANFVGLARGRRPFWDANAGEWVRRPFYDGLTFHRVVPEYLVQTGDYLGDGTGNVGYTIPDEPDETLSHDRRGLLCMANHDGANTAGGQFFITDGPAAELDQGGYTIFGLCNNLDVVSQIARVPQRPDEGNRPLTPIHVQRLTIHRVEGGAANVQIARPQLPPGEPEVPRGASQDPTRPRSRDGRAYPEPSPIPGDGTRHGPPTPPMPRHPGHGH